MGDSSSRTDEQLQVIAWPVGVAFLEVDEKDPADLLGFGKWKELGKLDVNGTAVYVWVREE